MVTGSSGQKRETDKDFGDLFPSLRASLMNTTEKIKERVCRQRKLLKFLNGLSCQHNAGRYPQFTLQWGHKEEVWLPSG